MEEAHVKVMRMDAGWAYFRFVSWSADECPCFCHGREDGEVEANRQTCDHCHRKPSE